MIQVILQMNQRSRKSDLHFLNQVLHAFFVSSDDIDLVADKLRDAKLELVEMYHDRYER